MRANFCGLSIFILIGIHSFAQTPAERSFSVSPARVQAMLKDLPGGISGPLPVLDGFVNPGKKKLSAYKRPFYQCTVQVNPAPGGGSVVRVTSKITAWNSDSGHSGYEVLQSNGRIESDLLDRLAESLNANTEEKTASKPVSAAEVHKTPPVEISAPMPQFPKASSATKLPVRRPADASSESNALEAEAKGLEELLQNQSRPTNLVAVKQDQTPILQNPSSDATVLFYASAEDEFEILDSNPEWVHVRISGLSRGWLRSAAVEVLNGSEPGAIVMKAPAPQSEPASTVQRPSKLFSQSGEEEGTFPGEWAPLKGKSVKIISIQQAPGTGRITSPQDKMRFAETLFKTDSEKSAAGLVLIFDAEDGGMVAATRAAIDSWKSGTLSEQAFWKQCYLDPPEILGSN